MNTAIDEFMAGCEADIASQLRDVEAIARGNQRRVLEAFWKERVSAVDLQGSTGYGLDDEGRDKLERIYADVFQTQAAIVRPQIVSGTHALALGMFGVCRPGDEIVFATGRPYDTLEAVVGIRKTPGSLREFGVESTVVPMNGDEIDLPAVLGAISERTKLVMFQRSRGYSTRKALPISALEKAFVQVKERYPHVIIGVDNCYGEFVEDREPCNAGADLVMGSLIKNPGAGIATTGGYVAGRADLIELAASRLTAPGMGTEYGPSHDFLRPFYQALFLAPHTVSQAVKSSILASRVFEKLGFRVSPGACDQRTDLIVTVQFDAPEPLLQFCQAIQSSAPIDSFVRPEAGSMAGYEDEVVMAAGAFVQGGSLELSADAPMRPPYIGYYQGGLTYEHAYLAIERIAQKFLQV